ncbi:NAD-dependent malic enzyme [Schaedlerella arabinosiphila]|uniref:NAD-dependent malic enzyme n=1 Tax=Schaedlerella arabinosiphila TaxID=2044587 RepID=A0A9X5CCZ5_9FIRM|nr:malic enzyme-like NAD(P)-binding protein [Schaedlerella arabinosiphila]KAI4444154.1 NAD-dependent malic enzyme [Schaedlerella arabinosiphila]MCI9604327.1 NAD-dependent malic enzyme [Ruminococcus sp.]NDO70497.1 NAD-dependent malic enzyme [Schaedlerella arabinosiphila]
MDYAKESLKMHYDLKGKIEIKARAAVDSKDALSLAYTPGVAEPCLEIQRDLNKSFQLTRRWNTVAVVTDGTAVLGLGDIGPEAGMPVMEGKCVLFKAFGDVDAIPLCIRSKNVEDIVETVRLLAGSFGGVNLEDISAPRCFEIEKRLKECCDIPIFHDDQHGTAVITLAGVLNALKLVGKKLEDVKIVTSGAGAAGIAIIRLLISMGLKNVIMTDRRGAIYRGRDGLNPIKEEMAEITNGNMEKGSLAEVIQGADVFIGVSAPGTLTKDMVHTMAKEPIIFACANPTPEIFPEEAKAAGAAVVSTGRSDYPNQVNNVLCFPGLFRGALDVHASDINDEMKVAAAYAIAGLVSEDELNPDYILPAAFDPRVKDAVASAVSEAAKKSGVARLVNTF